jgi:hypothetical protein
MAELAGAFIGALALTFIVFRVCKKYTDPTRKGILRAFFIGLLVVWVLRIAVWQILDGGHGDISISLICYTITLMIWMIRDYRNTESPPQSPRPAPSTNNNSTSPQELCLKPLESGRNAMVANPRLAAQLKQMKQNAIEAQQLEDKTDAYQAALAKAEKKSLAFLADNAVCKNFSDSKTQEKLYACLLVYLTTYKAWKDSGTDIHQSFWNTFQRRIEVEMLDIKDYGHVDSRVVSTPDGGKAFAHFSSNYWTKMDELANVLNSKGVVGLVRSLLDEMKNPSELEEAFTLFFNRMSREAEPSLVKMIADLA